MSRSLILAAPWVVLAVVSLLHGEPVSAAAFAALCAAMAGTFVLDAWSERSAADRSYLVGIRHACEEVRREAQTRATPAEASAVLDAAERVIKLVAKEPR